jgi:hypothetical protein
MSRSQALRSSHAGLMRDLSGEVSTVSSRRSRLDAIIVPASRPASFLTPAITLAAQLHVPLLVLCSRRTHPGQVARRVAQTPGAFAHAVEIHEGWAHESLVQETSAPAFHKASADRSSDLSLKRNLGLLVARQQGWNKVLFLDDDITGVRAEDVARLAVQLDRHHVAGMAIREFPDNSVACHARRLVGLPQDNFISGAALGVNCADHPVSIFPDIYNEDWFFFARSAAQRELIKAGEARQEEYAPFADPGRARREEFGDLLAEGLYALFEDAPSLTFAEQITMAGVGFWDRTIDSRHRALNDLLKRLARSVEKDERHDTPMHEAIIAVTAAEKQLAAVTPELCVAFLQAWQEDLVRWQQITTRANPTNPASVYEELGLKNVRFCSFGDEYGESRVPAMRSGRATTVV